jgi:hypothetical protein
MTSFAERARHTVATVRTALPKPRRMPELDALRGLFLVWMTLTHLPTKMSDFVNQPFGFVSSAEGFVFMSALLTARVYLREAMTDEARLRAKLWRRSLRIYGYHLAMLFFAFTFVAWFAATTHRPALYNLLNFYIAHPFIAVAGSLLLLYTPPLLDILPMYVLFLLATPSILSGAIRIGWKWILLASFAVWIGAQYGLREAVHGGVVAFTHLQIPLQEGGAFNLFAWQWVWVTGLWVGARSAEGRNPLAQLPRWTLAVAGAVCIFFIGVRHGWLGPHLTQQSLGIRLDKWQIGPMRMLNLIALAILLNWSRKYLFRIVSIEPFLTLGKASLEVFCAHVFFVFLALGLVYGEATQLHGPVALAVLAATFSAMMLVAIHEIVKTTRDRKTREKQRSNQPPAAPFSSSMMTAEPTPPA